MNPTPTSILLERVTSHSVEGLTNATKGHIKKNQAVKPKLAEEEVVKENIPTKTGKGVLKKMKKTATKKP